MRCSARNETTQFWVFSKVYGKCTNQGEFVSVGLMHKSSRICDAWIKAKKYKTYTREEYLVFSLRDYWMLIPHSVVFRMSEDHM